MALSALESPGLVQLIQHAPCDVDGLGLTGLSQSLQRLANLLFLQFAPITGWGGHNIPQHAADHLGDHGQFDRLDAVVRVQHAPESGPNHLMGSDLAWTIRIGPPFFDEYRSPNVRQHARLFVDVDGSQAVGPRGLGQHGFLRRPRTGVARGASQPLEVDNGNAFVLGNRRAQSATGWSVAILVAQMTPLTRTRGRHLIVRIGALAFVASDDVVVQSVAMAIHTGQTRSQVNILVGSPLLRLLFVLTTVQVAVAIVAPMIRNLPYDVQEDVALGVEYFLVVRDTRRLFLGLIGHERIVRRARIHHRTANTGELARSGGRPAEIVSADLNGITSRTALVLAGMRIVACQAVDLQFSGGVLCADRLGVGRGNLPGTAAGHVPAENPSELRSGQSKLLGPMRARPGPVRQGHLNAQLRIEVQPRLARPTTRDIAVHPIEVPAPADCLVTVTFSARKLRGKWHGQRVIRIDL